MKITKLNIPGITDRQSRRPLVIAGPCSAESRDQVLRTAEELSPVKIMRAGLWKPRTKPGNFEGVGAKGLPWLAQAKERTGILIATEVATPAHWKAASAAGIDIVWIGARTVSNPFAVQELADAMAGTSVPVLVKNPLSPDLELWCGALERLYNSGIVNLGAIHRGFSSFGDTVYRNNPLWNIPIELKRRFPEITLFCDPSHIGGSRKLIAPLCQQAMDLNYDGLFIESHCDPSVALSDAMQQITPEELHRLLSELVIRDNVLPSGSTAGEDLSVFRRQIDEIDTSILKLLSRRMEISRSIGAFKKEHGIPILQSGRYSEILSLRRETGSQLRLSPAFVEEIMKAIHEESVKEQM